MIHRISYRTAYFYPVFKLTHNTYGLKTYKQFGKARTLGTCQNGEKVLRPGGKELTLKMIDALKIQPADEVVEFAPGLGFTAQITLSKNPKTYTAVELNPKAVEQLRPIIHGNNRTIINGSADETGLSDQCATVVYGEAMLTMQTPARKKKIIAEAFRLLKQNGRYGIHELALKEGTDPQTIKELQKDLARTINVNALPLIVSEWERVLKEEGFAVVKTMTNPMHLLEKQRMIDDEGFFNFLKIAFNILTHPTEAAQIREMRRVFRKYKDTLTAVSIIAVRPA